MFLRNKQKIYQFVCLGNILYSCNNKKIVLNLKRTNENYKIISCNILIFKFILCTTMLSQSIRLHSKLQKFIDEVFSTLLYDIIS